MPIENTPDFDREVEEMMKRQRLDYESATLRSCSHEIMTSLMGYLVVVDPRDVAYCYEWFNPNTDSNIIGTASLLAPGARYGFDPGSKVISTEIRDHNGDGDVNLAPPWSVAPSFSSTRKPSWIVKSSSKPRDNHDNADTLDV